MRMLLFFAIIATGLAACATRYAPPVSHLDLQAPRATPVFFYFSGNHGP